MGRHSGFIACYAALARSDADVVLIPEVPFVLDGPHGLLEHVRQRVAERGNAVVVVAEGAGQDLLEGGHGGSDASGNTKLRDIGPLLRTRLVEHFEKEGVETSIRYIDPSESLRQRLLRAAVAGRGARRDVGPHRDGGGPLAATVRAPADGAGREPAQPGRPAR